MQAQEALKRAKKKKKKKGKKAASSGQVSDDEESERQDWGQVSAPASSRVSTESEAAEATEPREGVASAQAAVPSGRLLARLPSEGLLWQWPAWHLVAAQTQGVFASIRNEIPSGSEREGCLFQPSEG